MKSNLPYTHNTRRCHFNSHSLRSVSGFCFCSVIAPSSFQLALTTECIRQIFRFSNCFNSFNSHSLRSVSSTSAVYNSIYRLSTRARYGAYLGKQHEYIREVHLSTRTHYGVYRTRIRTNKLANIFQLAPSTKCIL